MQDNKNHQRGRAQANPRNHHNNRDTRSTSHPLDTSGVVLATPSAQLFDTVAEKIAKTIAKPEKDKHNKSTQLRGFYDEIVMWEQKTRGMTDEKFTEFLPLIRMINAKVAYAKGRDLVDDNYFELVRHCLQQVNSPATLRNFKLFMEAVTGFLRYHDERSN